MQQFFSIQEQITPTGPLIELIQILLDINILPKFAADQSIIADDTM